MKLAAVITLIALVVPSAANAQYLGNYTSNQYQSNRVNPYQYSGGSYGNGTNSPGLYTQGGQFRGNVNTNRFDPNSVANPYGRYGSQFSPDSINNQFGAGSQFNNESPNNPYGQGLRVCGPNGCE